MTPQQSQQSDPAESAGRKAVVKMPAAPRPVTKRPAVKKTAQLKWGERVIRFLRDVEKITQTIIALIIAIGAAGDVTFIIAYNLQHLHATLQSMAFLGA